MHIDSIPAGASPKNIRTQPGATDPTSDVGDVNIGDTVLAYLASPSNGWVYVVSGNTEGWVLWSGITATPIVQNGSGLVLSAQDVIDLQSYRDGIDRILKGAKPPSASGTF